MEAWRERSKFWSDAFTAKEKDLRAEGYGHDVHLLNRKCAEYADVMTRERYGAPAEPFYSEAAGDAAHLNGDTTG